MNIDVNDRITLDDDLVYLVAGKVNYLEKIYYFLVDINNYTNVKCCYENTSNHSVIEINDKKLIQELLPMFMNSQNEKYIEDLVDNM